MKGHHNDFTQVETGDYVNTYLLSSNQKINQMREIKFRAWHRTRKEMFSITDLTFLFESINGIAAKGYSSTVANFDIMPEDLILMQYTGLTDKNGKEIYEGDIVESSTLCNQFWNEENIKNYVVGFDQGTFCFYINKMKAIQWNDGSNNWYSLENTESFDIEVIGNIHENPELIKQIKIKK